MRQKVNFSFRIIFLGGIVLLFISLFLDWYSFQVYDVNNELIATWSYNILFEWSTEFLAGIGINEEYRPANLNVHSFVNIVFIILLVASIYIILFKEVDSKNTDSLTGYPYILIFMVILVIFYIGILPVVYLFPNQLYFPVLSYFDIELEITFSYSISFGYILQLCGFILVFPYSLYYFLTITELERSKQVPHVKIEKYIEIIQEPLDIDRLIAEEHGGNYYD
ncbi:MAG: hypothetical protein ACXAEX_01520 [Promethearchaeota archaeon]|jgi:hypothetical protein